MRYEKSCGAIIFQEKRNELFFLLVQMKRGHWSFPKGHMKDGESELETAKREVKEETNLIIDIIPNFRKSVSYLSKTHSTKEVVYFLAKATTDNVKKQDKEIKAISWCTYEEADNLLSFFEDKENLRLALFQINNQL
jgi:8-oxo-dGTP pyrophosphatase MutT (NUDIX family)